ncbi:sigma-70 family RNA polymerase sigma factor [Halopseudomonas sabulinigri]|uniref:Sigma-70 family RNA polymerase sigma factor n=2 Tax=Halopseudomonas sabulinigri TaxID=472181 RepID=A0ABP9ZJZ5_9GAMM
MFHPLSPPLRFLCYLPSRPSMPATETTSSISIATLYSEHHGWLFAWLRRKLGCAEQAADVAQDTFVRVLVRNQAVSNQAPKAFLSTIARGLVIDHWRRSALENAYLQALAQLPEQYYPSAEEQHQTLQTLEQIAALLEGLKARVRTAFLLYQLGGLTHAQIATQLGVSSRTVERHVADALFHCYQLRYREG